MKRSTRLQTQSLELAAHQTLAASLRYTAEFLKAEVARHGLTPEQKMQAAAKKCAAEYLEKEAARLEEILVTGRIPGRLGRPPGTPDKARTDNVYDVRLSAMDKTQWWDGLSHTERMAEIQRKLEKGELTKTQPRHVRDQMIYAEYVRGEPATGLAKRYGLSSVRIHQIVHEQSGEKGSLNLSEREARNQQIWGEHAAGATIRALAERYKVTRQTIHKILSERKHAIADSDSLPADASG